MMTLPRSAPAAVPASAPATWVPATESYRHDLDGLRGVAIALVAMFHIWFGRASGGVDVFLALSGFFFGGKVLRTALNPAASLSLAPQIVRLVRRLLPALVVVLATGTVLTVMVQPRTRWEAYADQSLASLGYYQNWELSSTVADYLRAGEAVSPLQHIWSMSVQGQFYIGLLVVVFGFAYVFRRPLGPRLRIALAVGLSALTVASFCYAIYAHHHNQALAYYDSFARAWELLIGALAGALIPYINWPMWLRTVIAGAASGMILCCGALINGTEEFPGPWALVPVGATVLFILAAANRHARADTRDRMPLPNRLLSTGPLTTLGAMAYSLYLWHWPLLIFWLSYTGHRRASFLEGAVLLLISGVLAHLTMRFIEDRLRVGAPTDTGASSRMQTMALLARLRRPTIALGSAVGLLAVTLTVTSFSWHEHVTGQRKSGRELSRLSSHDYPGAQALTTDVRVPTLRMRPTVLEAKVDVPLTTKQGCITKVRSAAIINCVYGDQNATRTIALAGSSHSEHWLPALNLLGQTHHFKVVTYLKMGCPLTTEDLPLTISDNIPYPECHEWVQRAMTSLVTDHPDYVFTTSTRPWKHQPGDMTPESYLGIWQTLSDNGIPILAMRDSPWLMNNGKPFRATDCLAGGGNAILCGVRRADVLSERNPTLDYLTQFPLLRPLDMSDALCRAEVCRAVEGNVLIYHDSHHLSATYVRTMTNTLGQQLGAATGWW